MDNLEVSDSEMERHTEQAFFLLVGHLVEHAEKSIYVTSQDSHSSRVKAIQEVVHKMLPQLLGHISEYSVDVHHVDFAIADVLKVQEDLEKESSIRGDSEHFSPLDICAIRHSDAAKSPGFQWGVRAAAQVVMTMPFKPEWTEITDRLTDTNSQALAWRTSMAILDILPKS